MALAAGKVGVVVVTVLIAVVVIDVVAVVDVVEGMQTPADQKCCDEQRVDWRSPLL